ncbi:hypothetical protein NC653_017612 [Populus alba x Populus x berolinensis]|uniref:Uncharacterized protein n=1 Tax=Populus alba x Populus x berolinensis TaxID=444605 RepID=A0AAD6W0R0_9ROSI|nr:hypothetical protein NC653_017612 [Populus alba x Populus x berolinensis]
MGHMQTARMPMARGQHLEKSATVEPSKQAEGGEEDRRPNYKQTEKEQKNNKPSLLLHSFKLSSPSNANNKSNSNKTVTSNYNPSRRLALFQLGTDIPLSQLET